MANIYRCNIEITLDFDHAPPGAELMTFKEHPDLDEQRFGDIMLKFLERHTEGFNEWSYRVVSTERIISE